MKAIRISDISMKQKNAAQLTFREKLELAKLLDRLELDVIEMAPLGTGKGDSLLVKSVAQSVKNSIIAVSAGLEKDGIDIAWEAVKDAARPRLQVICPVSTVQMEYLLHQKSDAVKAKVKEAVSYCRSLCANVEFIADDATRAEESFLYEMLSLAIDSGANMVSVCDRAGAMLPSEFASFIKGVFDNVSALSQGAELGVSCCDELSMADICSLQGAFCGASEIKTSTHPENNASAEDIVKVLQAKGEDQNICCNVRSVEMRRVLSQIDRIFTETKNKNTPFEDGVREDEDRFFTSNDALDDIALEVRRLGYDLSNEDMERVYETFKSIAGKKESVSTRELDAMVASSALQVPPTYKIEHYVINTGNIITATAHMRLLKDGKLLESVSVGDGPIDAAFLAIEQITGHHYELDDFQIRAVTEGRTAMGETIVKLRSGGKIYSGRGLSTDIIASGILAYINALNKIVYEEENA